MSRLSVIWCPASWLCVTQIVKKPKKTGKAIVKCQLYNIKPGNTRRAPNLSIARNVRWEAGMGIWTVFCLSRFYRRANQIDGERYTSSEQRKPRGIWSVDA